MLLTSFFLNFLLTISILLFVRYPQKQEEGYSSESIHILKQVQDANDLKDAVGRQGVYIVFSDNSWLALRYRDTHLGIGGSSAIVRDSEDNWFGSSEHFCGTFQKVKHYKKTYARFAEQLDENDIKYRSIYLSVKVYKLGISENLAEAHATLSELGFVKMDI